MCLGNCPIIPSCPHISPPLTNPHYTHPLKKETYVHNYTLTCHIDHNNTALHYEDRTRLGVKMHRKER
jgi:hypothetical protein